MPESPPPETLAWLHQAARIDGATYAQVLLHLLERVEALEQRSTCKQSLQVPPTPEAAPVATDEELCRVFDDGPTSFTPALRAVYNLGRQHGAAQPPAAQPAPVAAPAGGLVETEPLSPAAQAVLDSMYEVNMDFNDENHALASAALRAVADQVVPHEVVPPLLKGHELERLCQRQHSRTQFLALVAELEGADA